MVLPEGWEEKNLGELSEKITKGSSPKWQGVSYVDEPGVLFVTSENVGVGQMIFNKTKYVEDLFNKKDSKSILCKGDVLTNIVGASIGRTAIFDSEELANINQAVCLIRCDRDMLINKYLCYLLNSPYFIRILHDKEINNARANLSLTFFRKLVIPLPPLPEQKRIVAILDKAFAAIDKAIANTEKNLSNARELFESYLNGVFAEPGDDWEEKKLSEVCLIRSKLIDPRESKYLNMPHIGAGNMISSSKKLIDIKTAEEEGLKSGKFIFDSSMVLYSKIRPYLMKVSIPDFDGLCSADVYPLFPKEGCLDRTFLFYLLLSKNFTDYVVAGSARAGMPKVNRKCLFSYRTYFPNVEVQKKIIKKLDQLNQETQNLELIYQQKLTNLQDLKQSILQKAFAGELTAAAEMVDQQMEN